MVKDDKYGLGTALGISEDELSHANDAVREEYGKMFDETINQDNVSHVRRNAEPEVPINKADVQETYNKMFKGVICVTPLYKLDGEYADYGIGRIVDEEKVK